MLALTAPRLHSFSAYQYRLLGLDSKSIKRSNDTLAKVLQGGNHLTRAALNLYDDTVTRRRLEALFAGMAKTLALDTATLAADAVAAELRAAGVAC